MKANELMIGDWVSYRKDFPDRVNAIAIGGHAVSLEHDSWQQMSSIQPIPITPEILEKNGFHYGHTASEEDFCEAVGCGYPDKGWCFDEGAGEIKIIFPNETDGGMIRLDDQNGDRHLELLFVKQVYIHELQHAIRLCNIDKTIEL